MQLYFKNFFLVMMFFASNIILITEIKSELIYEGDKNVVKNTINEIESLQLNISLYESLLNDMEMIINQSRGIIEQLKKNSNRLIENDSDLSEMIFDYRSAAISLNKFQQMNIVSKETQVNILSSILFGVSGILTQKSKMDRLLNNEQIGGVLFLMTAMGIEFSSVSILEKIIAIIHKNCAHLKTDNLDNYIYEATIYDIFNLLSEKIINQNICSVVLSKIIDMSLTKMKDDINNYKNKNKNIKKKNKK